jgi:flagella basal body P-ring formation protein FlgA
VAAGVAVRRGETVVMRLRGPGFLLTGLGQALEDGRPGGFIKVRNVDSSRVITAKVAADGSVEPVFDGVK